MDKSNIIKSERTLITAATDKSIKPYQDSSTPDLNASTDKTMALNKSYLSTSIGSISANRSNNKSLVNLSRNRLLETLQSGMLLSLKIAKKQVEYDS